MRERAAKSTIRCAIYTRKSTEEGLEQDFSSLDAQREACAAYITSQRHEGWAAVPDFYDDGGYSGGNMERPALKTLLAAVEVGKVDVIVVYKVDRLTRSLADFAKIVEVLDAKGASFVSVTQSFNTTTSMGRLTLNVLLSFAQFEREVTGERIRDKIAASKKKGMWMGGPVPLGYDLQDRQLVINATEAETVRHIFRRYIELGSGHRLINELAAQGIRSKARVNRFGKAYGGQPIARGPLYAILQNRIYVGEVSHKGEVYPGQHPAIVERDLFEAVQCALAERRVERRIGSTHREPSLLTGFLWDGVGRRLSPSHAVRKGRRYRYYISHEINGSSGEPLWRISAHDIEGRVTTEIAGQLEQRLSEVIANTSLSGSDIIRVRKLVATTIERLRTVTGSALRALLMPLVRRIDVGRSEMRITYDFSSLDPALGQERPSQCVVPISCIRSGQQMRITIPVPAEASRKDPALIKMIVQALKLREASSRCTASSFDELARGLGFGREYAADLLRLSYLAPDIVDAIIDGRQPAQLTRTGLIKTPRLSTDWHEQRLQLGFA